MLIKEDLELANDEERMGQLQDNYIKWMDDLIASGQYVYGGRLQEGRKTFQKEGNIVSDGPYVETKEIVGGIVVFDAVDLEAAKQIVSNSPMSGILEVDLREVTNVYTASK